MRNNKDRKNIHATTKKEESSEWLVSYSDIVTVLLCFFIIFYAAKQRYSSVKQEEMQAIVQLLSNKGMGTSQKSGNKFKEYIKKQVERKKLMNEIKSNINIQMGDRQINIITEANKVHVQFDHVEFFKTGSMSLTKEGKEIILNIIDIIKPYKNKIFITVEGYSDSTPVKGYVKSRKWNTNIELSVFRSLTVNNLFMKNGFDKQQMAIAGYGSNRQLLIEELVDQGRSIATIHKAIQRRVSISLSAR